MVCVRAISGLGGKGPACFLIEGAGARILLDFGEGPQPGLLPDIDSIGPVDALLLSHQHADHMGALRFLQRIGNPRVYASEIVARTLPQIETRSLPLNGAATVCGIPIATGRSGHAPGGIWIHLAVGDGFLYMGDNCVESPLYVFDQPPAADTIILDASYGDYEKPFAESCAALDRAIAGERVVLPVPAQGRGPEIALHLLDKGIVPHLDDAVREAVRGLARENAACVKPERVGDLERLLAASPPPAPDFTGVTLCSPATGASGTAKRAIEALQCGADMRVIFTGYVAPETPADAAMKAGGAQSLRWNIHPRLSDNAALVKALMPRTVLPAFGDKKTRPSWEKAFAPSRVVIDGAVTL